jgi:transposase
MKPTEVKLTPEERAMLESWLRSTTTEQRMVFRSRIILAAAEGRGTGVIATQMRTRPTTVSQWRVRFAERRLAGLEDRTRPGRPPRYGQDAERRVLAKLEEPPPESYAKWNGRLLAEALRNVSRYQVWRILGRHGISLERRRSWCVSTDPAFATKAADVVGLYLAPPENAVVISVDEKPHIQALERAQGWLRLPNGRALTGFSHQYKRNGTTTLFAALNVVTGMVQVGHYQRRRRREFLDFMNDVVAIYPDRKIHVVLDNLSTHNPRRDLWLARHPNVQFHFTPTYASWLNQVEVWFSIMSRSALHGASFASPRQVRDAIDAFVQAYNERAAPFEWTKQVVHPKSLSKSIGHLRK